MTEGREPVSKEWFVEKLGASQQRVRSLVQANSALKASLERVGARAEYLEAAIMEIHLDLAEGRSVEAVQAQVRHYLKRLDEMLEEDE